MLRFAPSPIGDMHISSLRVAIFNYILSKQQNEDLLIRIEDTDKEKNIEGKDKEILEILSLFSIDHKHVAYQSENLKYHQKMAMQLMSQKKAFACFCSENKLKELKQEAMEKNKPYEYDGFCATLSDETVLNCNAPFTVRIQKPEEDIQFKDAVQDKITFTPSKVDAFFILNHDKSPTYDYACAVDDMLFNISTIIKEEKELESTPKQIHIRKLLGYDKEINYIHLPEVVNTQNPVKWFINEGFLPSAIANYLVLLGNDTPAEIFSLEEAIEWFDINKTSKAAVSFDLDKLRSINKIHLDKMDNLRLSKLLGFADEDIGQLAKIFLEDSSTLKEVKSRLDLVFASKNVCKGFEKETEIIKKSLQKAPYMDKVNDLQHYLKEQTILEDEQLLVPLNYLLTGQNDKENLEEIYPLIKNYLGEIVK